MIAQLKNAAFVTLSVLVGETDFENPVQKACSNSNVEIDACF
jgi:hypothetical protein